MTCEICDRTRIIERDGFILDPSGDITWGGQVVRNLGTVAPSILYELARANGRRLSADFLAGNCCGGEILDARGNIRVHVFRIRQKFRQLGFPIPIGTERNVPGYWWAV